MLAALLIFAALVFGVLSRGQPARWAEHSWNPEADQHMKSARPIREDEECGLLELRPLP